MGASSSKKLTIDQVVKRQAASDKLKKSSFHEAFVNQFKPSIEGRVLIPDDVDTYTSARNRPFNLDQRGYPLIIVQVKNVADVVKCVNFYRDSITNKSEVRLSIASGCHSSKCMLDDAFVIDLVNLKQVTVNVEKLTATVEGGAYLRELDSALAPHNLAVPVGTYPLTGVGGLVLGGGFGWLSRTSGLSVDNIVEVEVVLPTGQVVVANDNNEYADLIWGCRGGGGNFGIVTKFTLKAHQLPNVLGGTIAYLTPSVGSALTVIKKFDAIASRLPTAITAALALPAGAPIVALNIGYYGTETTPKKVPEIKELRELGGWFKVANDVKKISHHRDLQTITSPHIETGFIYTSLVIIGNKSTVMPDECWRKLLAHVRGPKPKFMTRGACIVFHVGGIDAFGNEKTSAISSTVRSSKYFCLLEAEWAGSSGELGKIAARKWCRDLAATLNDYKTTVMKYAADEINIDLVDAAGSIGYHEDMIASLRTLKAKYDVDNLFKENVNVLPAI